MGNWGLVGRGMVGAGSISTPTLPALRSAHGAESLSLSQPVGGRGYRGHYGRGGERTHWVGHPGVGGMDTVVLAAGRVSAQKNVQMSMCEPLLQLTPSKGWIHFNGHLKKNPHLIFFSLIYRESRREGGEGERGKH